MSISPMKPVDADGGAPLFAELPNNGALGAQK